MGEQIAQLISEMGGCLDSYYYTLSGDGVHGFIDMPDDTAATAMGLAINASAAVSFEVTAVVTPEDLDLATQMVPDYEPPDT